MIYNPAPLETLASYAIAFFAGAASVLVVMTYGKAMKSQA